MFFNKARFFALIAISLVMGCTSALYQPKPEHFTSATAFQEISAGRKAYVTKCSGCHHLYLPAQYSESAWKHNLDEMQDRSKINDQEKALIMKYVLFAMKPVAP